MKGTKITSELEQIWNTCCSGKYIGYLGWTIQLGKICREIINLNNMKAIKRWELVLYCYVVLHSFVGAVEQAPCAIICSISPSSTYVCSHTCKKRSEAL